jgi:hypothetical protein
MMVFLDKIIAGYRVSKNQILLYCRNNRFTAPPGFYSTLKKPTYVQNIFFENYANIYSATSNDLHTQ